MKKGYLLSLLFLCTVGLTAQTVTVDFTKKRQLIRAHGINMEGYHVGPGGEPLGDKFVTMVETLPCQVGRFGLPLVEWEPVNDNDDPDIIDWEGFHDSGWVPNTFKRIQELKRRGIESWVSIWNCESWNLRKSAPYQAGGRLKSTDEMAESICAYLLRAKENYDAEVKWVSFNESLMQDPEDGGWGGYNIALSVDEYAAIIKKTGQLFDKYGIRTKWLIGCLSMTGSELRQADEICKNPEIRKYIDGVDFHSYEVQYYGCENKLKAWGDYFAASDLPTYCGELDNYNFYTDKKGAWLTHGMETGYMYQAVFRYSWCAGAYPWFPESPVSKSPYRYVDLHYFAHIPPGYTVVETSASDNGIYAVGACTDENRVLILQNNSTKVKEIEIAGFPATDRLQVIQSYYDNYGIFTDEGVKFEDGKLKIRMKPSSLYSVGTDLARLTELKLAEPVPDNLIEAEDGTYGNGSEAIIGQTGYTGYGYIDFGGKNSWTAIDIEVPENGNYDLTLRYSCSTQRTCDIYVNDRLTDSYTFTVTGNTPVWGTTVITVPFIQGKNTLKIVATTSKGGPNLDSYTWQPSSALRTVADRSVCLWPTVVSDWLQYELDSPGNETEMQITDLTGHRVKTVALDRQRAAIDLSDLPAGIYLIRIEDLPSGKVIGWNKIIKK